MRPAESGETQPPRLASELAAVHDADMVLAAVMAALGVQQESGVPVIRWLAAALARQQALVALDNCEHLLDPVADLCGALLALVARGQTDAQIAAQLYISLSTVRSDLDRIRDKASCRRRADLTRLALQTGLV